MLRLFGSANLVGSRLAAGSDNVRLSPARIGWPASSISIKGVRSKQVADFLPEALRSWEMIVAPLPQTNHFPVYEDNDLVLTSPYIDLNVFSVSPDTVLVNEACPELMRTLEQHHFTVVPVRHRHRRLFGGGFHCFTLDTVRDGGLEDYLRD